MIKNQLHKAKILLVDDSHSMRKLLRAMIEAGGYRNIIEAEHGVAAMHAIQDGSCDILVTDWKMEPMDGLELSKRLRAFGDERQSCVPIVLVTAFADAALVANARDIGINEVLTKPVAAKVIQTKIETLLTVQQAFIRAENYKGPDRRRQKTASYAGQERRRANPPVIMQVTG